MPKRKLSNFGDNTDKPLPSMQTTRLTQLFTQGVQTLSRALKTARGFERQKLGRREKTARAGGDEKTVGRLGEETGVLKVITFAYSVSGLGVRADVDTTGSRFGYHGGEIPL